MCDKCNPEQHKKYWVHIADEWALDEMLEMLHHLKSLIAEKEKKIWAKWDKLSLAEKEQIMRHVLANAAYL